MVPCWPGPSRGLRGLGRTGRLDGLGAERAADLAVAPDPRGEHQAVNYGVAIKGQPGLFASHLDPDGFACLTVGLDRVQAHRPDRFAVARGRLPFLVLVVRLRLRRAGHAELDAVRVDQKSHDLVLSEGDLWAVFDPALSLDYTSLTVKLARSA